MSRLRWKLNSDISLRVYKSFILPIIEYGLIFTTLGSNRMLDKLQKCQNKFLRLSLGVDRYTSNKTIHDRAKILPIIKRRKIQLLTCMYKLKGDGDRIKIINRRTRAGDGVLLKESQSRLQSTLLSCFRKGPRDFNRLSPNTRNIVIYTKFKSEIKKQVDIEYQQMFI